MLLALVLACSLTDQPEPEPVAPVEEAAPPAKAAEPVAGHMSAHFSMATVGIEAWVAGEFDQAQTRLETLSKHAPPEGLDSEEDTARLYAMRNAAGAAAKGGPPAKVAEQIGQLGATCGECHQAKGIAPKVDLGTTPEASDDRIAHMQGHQWAVKAMWASLVTNDADLWARGVAKLSEAPLGTAGFGEPEIPAELLAHEGSVHSLGAAAAKAETAEQRVQAFSKVATTCTHCHLVMLGE